MQKTLVKLRTFSELCSFHRPFPTQYLKMYINNFCFVSAGKNRRLKQAKEEAQAEIEQYRLQREKEFKTKEAAVRPTNTTNTNNLCSYRSWCGRPFTLVFLILCQYLVTFSDFLIVS